MEASIKFSGWSQARRVVLVREAPAQAPVGAQARRRHDHQSLPGTNGAGWDTSAAPWSGKIAVLVTSLDPVAWPTTAMPRLSRERADAENVFGELRLLRRWLGGKWLSGVPQEAAPLLSG